MTREEIIEQLDGIVGTYEILIGNGVNSDILDVDDIEAIREAISALSNKGEWIPVSERLPEEDGCYLVAVKFDRYISNEICYFDADDRERPFCPTRTNAGSQYINHGYPIEKTLAWTYSPEPYKAEKGGEE